MRGPRRVCNASSEVDSAENYTTGWHQAPVRKADPPTDASHNTWNATTRIPFLGIPRLVFSCRFGRNAPQTQSWLPARNRARRDAHALHKAVARDSATHNKRHAARAPPQSQEQVGACQPIASPKGLTAPPWPACLQRRRLTTKPAKSEPSPQTGETAMLLQSHSARRAHTSAS